MRAPTVSLLNDDALSYDGYPYYPLLLSIPDPENVFQLFVWDILFLVIFDVQRIRSYFEERHIRFDFQDDNNNEYVAALTFPAGTTQFDDNVPVRASRHFFGRVCREFLSLQDWMDETIEIVKNPRFDASPNQRSNPSLHLIANSDG
jgi:hypothetical protein